MRNRRVVFGWVVGLAGCLAPLDRPTGGSDVAAALAAFPEVEVLAAQPDGFPIFLRGDLGSISSAPRAESKPGHPVDTGEIVAVHPQTFFGKNRRVYSANHGPTLPGTLLRSEGQAPVADIDVNAVYAATGAFYEAYQHFWNRDSYDDAGAALVSSVHYGVNYCNLFWNGTQMVYGDGQPSAGCLPLARAVDLTAHELTHAVTERESALIYSGESGGLNEFISDAFGAFVEAWVDGGKSGTLAVSADTWKIGEDDPRLCRLFGSDADRRVQTLKISSRCRDDWPVRSIRRT